MPDPYIAEIKMIAFNIAPKGWALCNGQLLPINQNQALFSLLGTTYGGDGRVNFALPDLRGRSPLHFGANFILGQSGGEENHTLIIAEVPMHTHTVVASSAAPDQAVPTNAFWASAGISTYSANPPNTPMAPQAISNTGNSLAHPNLSPYQVINFIICLQGIFPSRN